MHFIQSFWRGTAQINFLELLKDNSAEVEWHYLLKVKGTHWMTRSPIVAAGQIKKQINLFCLFVSMSFLLVVPASSYPVKQITCDWWSCWNICLCNPERCSLSRRPTYFVIVFVITYLCHFFYTGKDFGE